MSNPRFKYEVCFSEEEESDMTTALLHDNKKTIKEYCSFVTIKPTKIFHFIIVFRLHQRVSALDKIFGRKKQLDIHYPIGNESLTKKYGQEKDYIYESFMFKLYSKEEIEELLLTGVSLDSLKKQAKRDINTKLLCYLLDHEKELSQREVQFNEIEIKEEFIDVESDNDYEQIPAKKICIGKGTKSFPFTIKEKELFKSIEDRDKRKVKSKDKPQL